MSKPKNFEDKMKRLEEIVNSLESSNKPLDTTLALFKEGVALSKECKLELVKIDAEIKKVLRETEDGDLLTEPFNEQK